MSAIFASPVSRVVANIDVTNLNTNQFVASNLGNTAINLDIDYLTADSVTIGGADNVFRGDTIDIYQARVNGEIDIDVFSGNDVVWINRATAGRNLKIDAGRGTDELRVNFSNVGGYLSLNTDSLDTAGDTLSAYRTSVRSYLIVSTGNGSDSIRFDQVSAGDLYVTTNGGNDRVVVNDSDIRDLVFARLGSGDDVLSFFDTNAGRSYLDGGSGRDGLNVIRSNIGFTNRGTRTQAGFEYGYDPVGPTG